MEKEEIDKLGMYLEGVIERIDTLDREREEVLRLNRKLNRKSGRGIALLVRDHDVASYVREVDDLMGQISTKMKSLERLTGWSPVISGVEEYCEFKILYAIIHDTKIPFPNLLNVPDWIWIVALGDVIGELRRYILIKLLDGNRELAIEYLANMDAIYSLIAGLEFPKSITGSLRNKIDVARAILERTQSDLLNSRN